MQNRAKTELTLDQSEKEILLKYFPKGICSFDLEMTGLSALFDKIIEIAACKLDAEGNFSTYQALVNPLIPIPEYTIEYHGLTNDHLRDCPTLKKPLAEFLEFFGSTPIMAHNAKFDVSFIIRGIHEFNYDISLSSVYDSCVFARTLFKKEEDKPKSYKLSDLASFFKVDFNHHIALDDSVVALKVFAGCLKIFDKNPKDRKLKDLSYLFKLNSFKPAGDYILKKKHEPLKEYILEKKIIQIRYSGGSKKSDFRPIKPISLMALPNGIVLYAHCQETDMNKYFVLKKIKEIKE